MSDVIVPLDVDTSSSLVEETEDFLRENRILPLLPRHPLLARPTGRRVAPRRRVLALG